MVGIGENCLDFSKPDVIANLKGVTARGLELFIVEHGAFCRIEIGNPKVVTRAQLCLDRALCIESRVKLGDRRVAEHNVIIRRATHTEPARPSTAGFLDYLHHKFTGLDDRPLWVLGSRTARRTVIDMNDAREKIEFTVRCPLGHLAE